MTEVINPETYDGKLHAIPCEVGSDFSEKWEAYRKDGFTVALQDGYILVVKLMAGDDIPDEIVWH